MIKEILAGLLMLTLAGCANIPFFGGTDLVATVLEACGDVPVQDFDECLKSELDTLPNEEGLTVGQLYELLEPLREGVVEPEVE